MLSQATTENPRFAQDFDDYRRACRERYLHQTSVQPILEENAIKEEDSNTNFLRQDGVAEGIATVDAATLSQLEGFKLTRSTELPANMSPAPDNLKKSDKEERRNSLSKFISSVFTRKPSSPQITSQKKITKEEREKNEQDWRMARFIAELEYEGKSDQEIQMQLFQIRDQSQLGPPRSPTIGDFFKSMSQAFKDEFSQRRDPSAHATATNPFYAAPSAMDDTGYTYEDLVALENVPRGVKCLEHLPLLTYQGQELPTAQNTCAVCMMEFEKDEELRGLHCTHHFHRECIDKWLSVGTTCPVCKSEVESDA